MSLIGLSGLDRRSWLQSLRTSAWLILIAVLGILLSWIALRIVWTQADHDLTAALYNIGSNDIVARLAWAVASVGNVIWVPLVFWLYVFRKDNSEWTSALVLAVAAVASMALSDLLKLLFHLPRPFTAFPTEFVPRFSIPTNYAFPSGHTTMAFTVLAVVWRRYQPWRVPFLALAIGTGIGMMIVGLHFASDVLAGAFLGTISGVFATTLARVRAEVKPVTS